MRYLVWILCFVGGVLVAYGLLDDNLPAVIVGVVLVLGCAAAGWWTQNRARSRGR